MESALIGLFGVVLGTFLTEFFHRKGRVEVYSQKVFERRLEVYEGLMRQVQAGYTVACEVMEAVDLPEDERKALISPAIHRIAEYTDENPLFVDRYVAAHVTSAFMGCEYVASIVDADERQRAIRDFREQHRIAKQLILEESGVDRINRHFRLLSRPRQSSPMIELMRKLERRREK